MKTPYEITDHEEGSRTMLYVFILLSVTMAAAAQLMLKHGMNLVVEKIGGGAFSPTDPAALKAVASTPFVYLGLAVFGLSAVLWLVVLSRATLSFAYPFAALTYVFILVFDKVFLHEELPPLRIAGVAFIMTGIVLVSRTPHQ